MNIMLITETAILKKTFISAYTSWGNFKTDNTTYNINN
jgi:hypothetical protein